MLVAQVQRAQRSNAPDEGVQGGFGVATGETHPVHRDARAVRVVETWHGGIDEEAQDLDSLRSQRFLHEIWRHQLVYIVLLS